jgi:CRISPR-associated protein Cmr6
MSLPLYKDAYPAISNRAEKTKVLPFSGGHTGLWYNKFVHGWHTNLKPEDNKAGRLLSFSSYESRDQQRKKITISPASEWVNQFHKKSVGDKKQLDDYCGRLMQLIKSFNGQNIIGKTDWHFVTGMGINHPVENGFTWHPTLGVPFLTGAAVKGLLRAWCEKWAKFDADTLRDWFGPSQNKTNKTDSAAGNLIFFDAIPTKPVQLQADVMMPHYDKWYEKGGNVPNPDGSNVPADWHSPVPVPFLAVAPGQSFLFSVSARPGCNINLDSVLKELNDALEWLGAGAKTAVGYGHMTEDSVQLKTLEDRIQKEKDEEASRIAEEEDLSQMSPFESELQSIIKANPNQKNYVSLLQSLESGKWTDLNIKMKVAQKIKEMMIANKVWKETGDPKKNKDHKRTLTIMNYLNQQ